MSGFRLTPGWLQQLQRQCVPLADRASEAVRASVVEVIETSPHTGREYPAPGGGTYRASAEGEPPASPTHKYPDSWQTAPAGIQGRKVAGAAFTDSDISVDLEYGTPGPPPIGPRPHVGEAIARAVPEIQRMLREAVR